MKSDNDLIYWLLQITSLWNGSQPFPDRGLYSANTGYTSALQCFSLFFSFYMNLQGEVMSLIILIIPIISHITHKAECVFIPWNSAGITLLCQTLVHLSLELAPPPNYATSTSHSLSTGLFQTTLFIDGYRDVSETTDQSHHASFSLNQTTSDSLSLNTVWIPHLALKLIGFYWKHKCLAD